MKLFASIATTRQLATLPTPRERANLLLFVLEYTFPSTA